MTRWCPTLALLASLGASLCWADRSPPVSTLVGHEGWVASVAFDPDGKSLASAGADRRVLTWDVASGRSRQKRTGHGDGVCAVAFAKGAVVSGGFDGTVRLWSDEARHRVLHRQRGAVLAVACSPDGEAVAVGGMDGVVSLLDVTGRAAVVRLRGHRSWVNSLAFSADGKRLLSGSSDGTARLWDVAKGEAVRAFALPTPREIRSAALSPDGKSVAAGVRFGAVRVWDVGGKEVANLDAHEGDAWAVAFAPDGKTLYSGGGDWGKPGCVRAWETKTWAGGATLTHPAEVLCLAVSADGRWLAAGGAGKTVSLWELAATRE